jgi:hypothetical protein
VKSLRVLLVIVLCSALPWGRVQAFDLPDEALKLLAQAVPDSCSICANDKTRKAVALLGKAYAPGTVVATDASCSFMKPSGAHALDLVLTCYPSPAFLGQLKEDELPPRVALTFYTPENRLVGIVEKDFTPGDIARVYAEAKPGTLFQGRVEIVRYPYGDGEGFNYFRESRRLQVHCRVLELMPVKR